MGLSPRLLRPRASGFHPDAADWRSRAISNSGTVSATTIRAVDTFCRDIAKAGLRDKFYRLNLFCGDNLNACLVPLYRGPSRTGTQYGNTTDTNANFVSGDYTETGTSGGLATGSSNTNKTLDTGFSPHAAGLVEDNTHMSYYSRAGNSSSNVVMASGNSGGANTQLWQFFLAGSSFYRSGGGSNSGFENQSFTRTGHIIAKRGSGGGAAYRNGSNLGVTSNVVGSVAWIANKPPAVRVFARRLFVTSTSTDTTDQYISMTLQGYSLGSAFDDSQALAYYNAIQAFQTSLGRQL
jgi:hypothetical protein